MAHPDKSDMLLAAGLWSDPLGELKPQNEEKRTREKTGGSVMEGEIG